MPDPSDPKRPDAEAQSAGTPSDEKPPRFHPSTGALSRLDHWMMQNPWHPRIAPMVVYLVLLAAIGPLRDYLPWSYPLVYTVQCGLVGYLLWRYRRLLPELNLRFHWLAVPVGVFVALAWVWLGMAVAEFDALRERGVGTFTNDLYQFVAQPNPDDATFIDSDATSMLRDMGTAVGWLSLALRFVGMSLLVPLFEELFIRSLMLRSFSRRHATVKGLLQVAMDIPLFGDWLSHTRLGRWANEPAVYFGEEFTRTRLGVVTACGFFMSTLIFMVSHVPRDYLGIVVCAAAYCALLAVTRRKGLGPVVWAHGITNALLWIYTIHTDDWRFL